MMACQKAMKACLEGKEPTLVEMANIAAHLEDSIGATREETTGDTDDQSGDRYLAVRRRRQLKKRTQGDGGSWQKLATARRR
jgi:hypothetical protein